MSLCSSMSNPFGEKMHADTINAMSVERLMFVMNLTMSSIQGHLTTTTQSQPDPQHLIFNSREKERRPPVALGWEDI